MSAIQKGDLVWIYRWPHPHGDSLGAHFVVEGFLAHARCSVCGEVAHEPVALFGRDRGVPVSWLKKVPPLSDCETLDAIAEAQVVPDRALERAPA